MKENKNPILAGTESALAFEEAMKEYIAELEVDSVVSYSHFTLRRLHNRFGKTVVQGWLKNHFDKK